MACIDTLLINFFLVLFDYMNVPFNILGSVKALKKSNDCLWSRAQDYTLNEQIFLDWEYSKHGMFNKGGNA